MTAEEPEDEGGGEAGAEPIPAIAVAPAGACGGDSGLPAPAPVGVVDVCCGDVGLPAAAPVGVAGVCCGDGLPAPEPVGALLATADALGGGDVSFAGVVSVIFAAEGLEDFLPPELPELPEDGDDFFGCGCAGGDDSFATALGAAAAASTASLGATAAGGVAGIGVTTGGGAGTCEGMGCVATAATGEGAVPVPASRHAANPASAISGAAIMATFAGVIARRGAPGGCWLSQPIFESVGDGVIRERSDEMWRALSRGTALWSGGSAAATRIEPDGSLTRAIAPLGRVIGPLRRASSLRGSSLQLCALSSPLAVTSSSERMTWPLRSSHGSGRSPNCLRMYDASDDGDAVSPARAAK
jgi:hypothetical protein